MTEQQIFDTLIHYADYDFLWKLSSEELTQLYRDLFGDEEV